jgi:hypothetical protein
MDVDRLTQAREAFEAFARRQGFEDIALTRGRDGLYIFPDTRAMWLGWAGCAATQALAAPGGWALVPVEATEAMLVSGGRVLTAGPLGDKYTAQAGAVYRAMIAAVPQEPRDA